MMRTVITYNGIVINVGAVINVSGCSCFSFCPHGAESHAF
ncbi:hypothetical protein SAMN04487832_11150 [Ruminococcus sp. XPD3002]|nr:hypothetical protein SAMN04487832_11150 [Ruminococcus flavefaciens]